MIVEVDLTKARESMAAEYCTAMGGGVCQLGKLCEECDCGSDFVQPAEVAGWIHDRGEFHRHLAADLLRAGLPEILEAYAEKLAAEMCDVNLSYEALVLKFQTAQCLKGLAEEARHG